MNIYCLIEDSQKDKSFGAEHGVSFYIETKKHKVLFDVGQSSLFLSNALRLNIDLSEVDIVVISHGHYDHGGGLKDFLRVNDQAKIYIQESAFDMFYSMRKADVYTYIGLDQELSESNRFFKIKGDYRIDDELTIISNIEGKKFYPNSNQTMFKQVVNELLLDDFSHEQSLIITCNNKTVLFAGCAHKGILNIIDETEKMIYPKQLSAVVGGFHLKSRFEEYKESIKNIDKIAHILLDKKIDKYYTGHCTGLTAYKQIKEILDQRLEHFYPGVKITL